MRYKSGLIIIELISVVVIMGIISLITILLLGNAIENTRINSCEVSANNINNTYHEYLYVHSISHNDLVYNDFLYTYYPDYSSSEFGYIDGKVICSKYIENMEEVQFL